MVLDMIPTAPKSRPTSVNVAGRLQCSLEQAQPAAGTL